MNRTILTILMFLIPITTFADVKLSGRIQGEIGSYRQGKWLNEDADFLRRSRDDNGTIANGGPNRLIFSLEEKLSSDFSAQALYQVDFSTANNTGIRSGQDAWVGLKFKGLDLRFGKLNSAYKYSKGLVDPWEDTSIQARSTAGGISGSKNNRIALVKKDENGLILLDDNGQPQAGDFAKSGTEYNSGELMTVLGSSKHYNLSHDGYMGSMLHLGFTVGGFRATVQGVVDDAENYDGIGVAELRYTHGDAKAPHFIIFASGSYIDLGKNIKDDSETARNWKVGGQYNFKMGNGKTTLGFNYEEAEIASFDADINPNGGKYILGSIDYRLGNVGLATWIGSYLSDIKESNRYLIDGKATEEDAISFAVGIKYFFSSRNLLFGGYRQTDSDNDYRDEDIFVVGLRHIF